MPARSSASNRSDSEVEPTRSQNITVTCRRSPAIEDALRLGTVAQDPTTLFADVRDRCIRWASSFVLVGTVALYRRRQGESIRWPRPGSARVSVGIRESWDGEASRRHALGLREPTRRAQARRKTGRPAHAPSPLPSTREGGRADEGDGLENSVTTCFRAAMRPSIDQIGLARDLNI